MEEIKQNIQAPGNLRRKYTDIYQPEETEVRVQAKEKTYSQTFTAQIASSFRKESQQVQLQTAARALVLESRGREVVDGHRWAGVILVISLSYLRQINFYNVQVCWQMLASLNEVLPSEQQDIWHCIQNGRLEQ